MSVFKNKVGRPSNKIKKIRAMLMILLILMVIGGICFLVNGINTKRLSGLTTDVTAPTISYLDFDATSVVAGAEIPVKTDAKDDISGISEIMVFFYNDNGSNDQFTAYVFDNIMYIPSNAKSGNYKITGAYLKDTAGNSKHYVGSSWCKENGSSCDNSIEVNKTVEVIAGESDTTGPVLQDISINKNTLNVGDTLRVVANAYDDKSGIVSFCLYVATELNGSGTPIYLSYNNTTKRYEGEYTIPNIGKTIYLTQINIKDGNGNISLYINKNIQPTTKNDTFVLDKLTITDGVEDKDSPKLESIKLKKDKVDAPYDLPISLTTSDDTGLHHAYVFAYKVNSDGSYTESRYYAYFSCGQGSGKQTCDASMNIDQYADLGNYVIGRISLADYSGKAVTYSVNPEGKDKQLSNLVNFSIVSTFTYDLTVSTSSSNAAEKIQNAQDGANIAIDCTSNPIISKGIFKAIQNTNKTIYIESNGITWVFNGKDITHPKDIDVTVGINYLYNDELAEDLENILNKAIVINFANNGKLPGKALVRIKADYTLKDYIGEDSLNVYFIKNKKSFNKVIENIEVTDDGYYEYYINHNSSFVLTNETVKEEYISEDTTDYELNKELNNKSIASKNNTKSDNKKDNSYTLIIVGVLVTVVIIAITLVILKKKKRKKISKSNTNSKKND